MEAFCCLCDLLVDVEEMEEKEGSKKRALA